jgi:hypothetical protein
MTLLVKNNLIGFLIMILLLLISPLTNAKKEVLENRTDIHTLAKQMGNSAAMIERHYSKLTATMAADRLA